MNQVDLLEENLSTHDGNKTDSVNDASSKKKTPDIEPSWLNILAPEFEKPYMDELRNFLRDEKKRFQVFPPAKQIFNAFWKAPFDNVKVVILGQDPYHGPGQAHGLCFSVAQGVQPPPSLKNIFLELNKSTGMQIPTHGCLEAWAKQGVFLLNTSLTVRAHQPQSHAGKGWEVFTDQVIKEINEKRDNVVFMLWGAPARKKAVMIDKAKHLVLEAPHPSPLSAHRGFIGCGHFVKANEYLKNTNQEAIDWSLCSL